MRGHCFVNGVEKHVKCAYVGVNGKAQYIMKPPGVMIYAGDVHKFGEQRFHAKSANAGNYAIIAGGLNYSSSGSVFSSIIDAYDTNLTYSNPTPTSSVHGNNCGACTLGNYALFGGGSSNTASMSYMGAIKNVDGYDSNLTLVSIPDLSVGRRQCYAESLINKYALFIGGFSDKTHYDADVYDTALTRISLVSLGDYYTSSSTLLGNKIFCTSNNNRSFMINSDLTVSAGPSQTENVSTDDLNSIGNYALRTGGSHYDSSTYKTTYYKSAEAYSVDGTVVQAPNLTYYTEEHTSEKIHDQLVILGGVIGLSSAACYGGPDDAKRYPVVDIYDKALTKSTIKNPNRILTVYVYSFSIGNYIAYGGGNTSNYDRDITVYTYNDGYTP